MHELKRNNKENYGSWDILAVVRYVGNLNKSFLDAQFCFVPRELNTRAHGLAKQARDKCVSCLYQFDDCNYLIKSLSNALSIQKESCPAHIASQSLNWI